MQGRVKTDFFINFHREQTNVMDYNNVLKFWFQEISPAQWWKKDPDLDSLITDRFASIYSQASLGELYTWRHSIRGRLAEVIILDQFSRNMFRGLAQSYATDAMALALSQEAIRIINENPSVSQDLSAVEKSFLYMPFMHSESVMIHEIAKKLFDEIAIQSNINSAKQHYDIIKRFGRYPHRNQLLWRESTPEEMEFLEQPGAGF
ncbi:MAG: hypothetical protein OFPII_01970 [Osedax symbiont Rs1]|nr:MAG: hypothetical protein OFPII_01970 [Osedax symbiont Rs1]